jgi:spore maturation protein CgeB
MKGRMVYVGSMSTAPDRDSGWVREIERLGWDATSYSSHIEYGRDFLSKLQRRLSLGERNRRMQEGLVRTVRDLQPSWVHFRLPLAFDKETINSIRACGAVVTQYFNDDPFSPRSPFALHWKFRRALAAYDAHFVYRAHNIPSYRKAGAVRVEHCPPTYDPSRHILQDVGSASAPASDAAFIGHWENDCRVACLDALSRAGFTVLVRGGMWDKALRDTSLSHLIPVRHAFGPEYNIAYANATAGLCFFSKINRDSWTERALEIVAVGGILVCERTAEAQRNFEEGVEAFFFSSIAELIAIVSKLKQDPELRSKVRAAGRARLLAGKHTIADRAQRLSEFVQEELRRRCGVG